MLREAITMEQGCTVRTDVCIVGAGPAGITVALELMTQGLGVILLEAGAETTKWRPFELRGEQEGDPYPPLEQTRSRAFGGTSLTWHPASTWTPNGDLRCHPLTALDFETRHGIPHTGWPFGPDEMHQYYERAHALMGLGDLNYEVNVVDADERRRPLLLDETKVKGVLFRFARRSIFRDLRPKLAEAADVTVLLNAQASEVETAEDPRKVSRIRIGGSEHQFWVQAKLYVLACGGIETPRLLLLSNRSQPAGLGNGHDLVGRYFMEHLTSNTGNLRPDTPDFWRRIELYRRNQHEGLSSMGAFRISEALQRQEGLSGVMFSPFIGRQVFFQPSTQALYLLVYHLLQQHRLPPRPLWQLQAVLRDPRPPLIASYLKVTNQIAKRHDFFGLNAHFEQAPSPDNRVTLGTEQDTLGLRVPKLEWRVGALERGSVERSLAILNEELSAAGVGSVQDVADGVTPYIGTTHHHMGTTRMHADPMHGVVDANCRVHETGNLFIAGSSVMPTGGAATVTMTLVALAIRLADYLKRELEPANAS